MVQDGRLLRDPHARVLRRERRRLRRLPRADREARLPAVARRRRASGCCRSTSPLRDGGYDISDFFSIQPDYGTVDDVRDFIEGAHQRGIRVVADLVMNHTSSDHPWFQESRSSPDNPKRDWYVWSDSRHEYAEARIIFTDTESSNWTCDDDAGSSTGTGSSPPARPELRQPRGPGGDARGRCASGSTSAWTASGSTRCRTCSSATARTARTCRRRTSTSSASARRSTREFPGRVLLAEANQWPADVVEYFGEGDECHMAFHFPVMPRMFMALRREERHPISRSSARRPTSRTAASGACSCATTTS